MSAPPETLCSHRLPPVLSLVRTRVPQLRLVVRPASRAELHRAIPERTADVCLGLGAAYRWPAAEVSGIRAFTACVAAGQGIALVPEMAVADELARGKLVRLPWKTPGEEACPVWMAWAVGGSGTTIPAVVTALREMLRVHTAFISARATTPERRPYS